MTIPHLPKPETILSIPMTQQLLFALKTTCGAMLILALAASCAPLEKAAPQVSALTLPVKTDKAKLKQGRQIYATSCTHCHGPARIDKHGDDKKWSQSILPKMCEKAKLSPAEADALSYYVITARNAPPKNG